MQRQAHLCGQFGKLPGISNHVMLATRPFRQFLQNPRAARLFPAHVSHPGIDINALDDCAPLIQIRLDLESAARTAHPEIEPTGICSRGGPFNLPDQAELLKDILRLREVGTHWAA